ncbi:hypothetical protein DFH07DRAFT_851754 [Mycena maculata]|uniref:DUF6593 domain-containing protein n=1 Tax=Mycena maculata TaxID=230809 RepID=A0AAD7HSU8_9AGAR|nr:hypothetical protein DFH07DRAFT_851754 [Mycena maculata]
MDSQLTLVNLPPPIALTFATDSMINATLYRNARPAYKLSTKLQGTTTELRDCGTSELLARIIRREILPDTVTFPNLDDGKDIRVSKWLRPCKLPNGLEAQVVETELGKCFLRRDPVHRLALYTEYDLEKPVAHWKLPDNASPLSLILHPGTENFHPQIIAAFTIEELKMRMAEKADSMALSRAAAHSATLVSLARN